MSVMQDLKQSLVGSYYTVGGINHIDGSNLPNQAQILTIINELNGLLFPGYFQEIPVHHSNLNEFVDEHLDKVSSLLHSEVKKSLLLGANLNTETVSDKATEIVTQFLETLVPLRSL